MSIERALFILVGILVMATALLAMLHHPWWGWFTLFIGFNMLQSVFTDFCPATMIMKKLGMKNQSEINSVTQEN